METYCKCQSPIDTKNNPDVTNQMVSLVNSHFTIYMNFGIYLKEKLVEKHMKPAELARRAGVTKQNIGRLLNQTRHPQSNALPKVKIETVDQLAKGLGVPIDEARVAAGYAPLSMSSGKPQTLGELISILETLGVENIHFADDDAMAHASPDDLQAALDAVKLALEITINRKRQIAPTNGDLKYEIDEDTQ